ncbi:MAG: type III pantothenate kinase [Flavobacteriales bacterium]|nr:type III pantothenate kinase [Flavobacteriales bacterium]
MKGQLNNPTSDVVIDVGNTRMKVALFTDSKLDGVLSISNKSKKKVLDVIDESSATRAIMSNVSKLREGLLKGLDERLDFILMTPKIKVPIQVAYKTMGTLGTDRLANAVFASKYHHQKNVLVIDFGTCIKYDLIREDGTYIGGAIAPGLQMRFKSMSKMTRQLPLIESWRAKEKLWPGNTTRSSMVAGVIQGVEAEIMHYIEEGNNRYDNLVVVATGGDYSYFEKAFKNIIFADPYLTLRGLHEILQYNMG